MDYNYYDFHGLGGNGYEKGGGAREVAKACGGTQRVKDSLQRLRDASNRIMKAAHRVKMNIILDSITNRYIYIYELYYII